MAMLMRFIPSAAILMLTSLLLLSIVVETSSEGVSLVFVFDATASMSDELAQAITGATAILNAALSNPQNILHNFVLVPFRDPDIGPVTSTTDSDEFKRELRAITVSGGGDCPESAVSGIIRGLQVGRPQSYIYVFTDASANDYNLTERAIELIQEKESKVVFIMTGNCNGISHPGYQCFNRIAEASSGELFNIDKGEVEEVLRSVIETTLPSNDTVRSENGSIITYSGSNLLSISSESSTSGSPQIPVDSQLADLTVTLSGSSPSLSLYDSNGNPPVDLKTVLSLSSVKIVKLENPKPGNWIIRYSSSGPHTLRVTGNSVFDFDARFGLTEAIIDFDSAPSRPIKGLPCYTYIRSSGLDEGIALSNITYMSLGGRVRRSAPLRTSPYNPLIYYEGPSVVADELYNIQVTGSDKNGNPFIRGSRSAISAVTASPTSIADCLRCTGDEMNRCLVVGGSGGIPQHFRCECKVPHFAGDGITCQNMDECSLLSDNCDTDALCTDTHGSFTCECKPGYSGDGVAQCSNINECGSPNACQNTGTCVDIPGSFDCGCYSGYRESNITAPLCTDIDECAEDINGCEQICNNTVGSYDCQCFNGFREGSGSTESGVDCTDIDECTEDADSCEQVCVNTAGSFRCQCFDGYRESYGAAQCEDIDECMEGSDNCTDNHHCINTPGSYQCLCNEGFAGNETLCTNIDECLNSTMNICSPNANCTDTVGSYSCHCSDGYAGDGINCTDKDECDLWLDNCDSNFGICDNTDGGFTCTCVYGSTGNGAVCTEIDPTLEELTAKTAHLSDVAAMLKAQTLEVERKQLEVEHETFLRQCALKGLRRRERREVIILGTITAEKRRELDVRISTLELANSRQSGINQSLKTSCDL